MSKSSGFQRDNTDNGTNLRNLCFPPSFFAAEVRAGFYVPEMMKRFWAGHLTVLSAVDEICERHHIPWYADGGTLLGAVRHGGFIPWDDDVDIVMFRSDLIRFLSVAEAELPEGLYLRDVCRQIDYTNPIVRVTSRYLDEGHLARFHGCPYTCNVDIFALDGLYPDSGKERQRIARLKSVGSVAAYFQPGEPDEGLKRHCLAEEKPDEAEAALAHLEPEFDIRIDRNSHPFGQLLRLMISIFSEYSDTDAHEVGLFMDGDEVFCFRRDWMGTPVWMPFEHLSLPVPSAYAEYLRAEYGDWKRVVRGGAEHGYPAYRLQEAHLRKATGKNPFRYTVSWSDLQMKSAPALYEQALPLLNMMEQAQAKANECAACGDVGNAAALLAGIRTLSESLKRMLGGAAALCGEAARLLTEYEEAASFTEKEPDFTGLAEKLQTATDLIKASLCRRREIVFLPLHPRWWHTMDGAYRKALSEDGAAVYVLPVPWYERDENGNTAARHEIVEGYPEDVVLTKPEEYDLKKRFPEVIVTQFPYDTLYRPAAPEPEYYAENLKKLTGRLIYIPCELPDVPQENDAVSMTTLRILIEQPATVLADEVRLQSPAMRGCFIRELTRLCGEDTRARWESRIICDGG